MSQANWTRRGWLRFTGAALVASTCGKVPRAAATDDGDLAPQRTITRGPKHHWFGYYDKLQFDPQGRYCLGMEVDFEHRSPATEDAIRIGIVDLQDGDRWSELGESRAWGWQQGCMLQFVPGSASQIVWNDRQGDRYVCHLLDIGTRQRRTVPQPIYCLSPDARTAFTADFRRINEMRPGYGYAGLADPYADQNAPQDSGVSRVDLLTGESRRIVSLAEAACYPLPAKDSFFPAERMPAAKHWFNHLLVNTDGTRLVFLHRWRLPGDKSWQTRMFSCAPDGSQLRCILNTGMVSHFVWRDAQHLLAWTRQPSRGNAFYVVEDREGGTCEAIGPEVMTRDGHCTYLPNREWIVNDTYPDQERYQHVYLYHLPTGRKFPLGSFHQPPQYQGEYRVDTHPRHTPDGRAIVIDTPHTGQGRQMHWIDISGITGKA